MAFTNPIYDLFWDSLSQKEQEVYALLSIPAWFNEDIANGLATRFNSSVTDNFYDVVREIDFVSRFEKKGWNFEPRFSEFLLAKAETLYQTRLTQIHEYLYSYYTTPKDGISLARKREETYLSFYHLIHIDPVEAKSAILNSLDTSDEKFLIPVLRSLVYICQLPPVKFEGDSFYTFLKLYLSAIENRNDKDVLKGIVEQVENIREGTGDETHVLFQKQLMLLLVRLYESAYPNKPKNILKKLKKLKHRLNHLTGGYSNDEDGDIEAVPA